MRDSSLILQLHAFLLNRQVLHEYSRVEIALLKHIFSASSNWKSGPFPPTHMESTAKSLTSQVHEKHTRCVASALGSETAFLHMGCIVSPLQTI